MNGFIVLLRHGHVTPLAADTLKDRHITVLDEHAVSADDASLAPRADVRVIAGHDDRRGEHVVACIVRHESEELTPLAVRRFCADRLAPAIGWQTSRC